MNTLSNIGAVILAAGSSSRLGRPKQLVEYQDKTLLQHTVDSVSELTFDPALLILGAHADEIRDQTDTKAVMLVDNEQWSEGIASSIRLGLSESLKLNASLHHILFLLSDQPYIDTELIQNLIKQHTGGTRPITACYYKEDIGVPAIFSRSFFPQLMNLTGDIGAKKIIAQNIEKVATVRFKKGFFDVDTVEDVNQLHAKKM